MQSVCLKEAGVPASGSLEEDTTLIGLTFGGYLRSKVIYVLYEINHIQKAIHSMLIKRVLEWYMKWLCLGGIPSH